MYMQKTNIESEAKFKKYKRGSSMGGMNKRKKKTKDQQEETYNRQEDPEHSPKAHSIHTLMRKEEDDNVKITDLEKKNMKKRFL